MSNRPHNFFRSSGYGRSRPIAAEVSCDKCCVCDGASNSYVWISHYHYVVAQFLPIHSAMEPVQGLYTQREPKTSPLYRLVMDHFEELKLCYQERFEQTYGSWKPHWESVVERFLQCGDLFYGFARVYCHVCCHTFIVPFSCKAREFCPSCEAKRRASWAMKIIEEVLPCDLAYRMLVFTIPICLRRIFMRERQLLGDFARVSYDCTRRFLCEQFPGIDGVPYFVSAVQTWGDLGQIHPHLHCLVSLGIKDKVGVFYAAPETLDFSALEQIFRSAMLKMLREKNRITEKTQKNLLSWKHSGFSTDASVAIAPGDSESLERVACYVLRPPISLQRLTYESGSDVVIYRGKYNPSRKRNFEPLDAKEFLVRLLCHVPVGRECTIRYFGAAASTERRGRVVQEDSYVSEESKFVKKRRSSWAKMLKRVYGIDPLLCPKCGSLMKVIAMIHDPDVIERILKHLDRWDPPRGPPLSAPGGERTVVYDEANPFPDHDEYEYEYDHAYDEIP